MGRTDAYLHVMHSNSARLGDELIGNLQVVSNIDAPQALCVFEAWIKQDFGDENQSSWLSGCMTSTRSSTLSKPRASSSTAHRPRLEPVGRERPVDLPGPGGLALRMELPLGRNVRGRFAVLDAVLGKPDSRGSHSIRIGADEGMLLVTEIDATWISERVRVFGGGWVYTRRAPKLLAETAGEETSARNQQAHMQSSIRP